MRRVPVRELNQNTAAVLAFVERGERIEVTRNGVPVAVLEPPRPSPLQALLEAGELRMPVAPLPLDVLDTPENNDSAGSDAVLEDRNVGRW